MVTLFYGRVGQENRFAQEDRELNLDRIFSTNLDAQALASVVGLFVWNVQTVAGWKKMHASDSAAEHSSGASDTLPPQPLREVEFLSEAPESNPPNPLITFLETKVDWNQLPADWHWEPSHGLHCPAGNPMRLKRAFDTTLIFRAGPQICPGCPRRADCSRSTQPRFRKELHVPVPASIVEKIREFKKRRLKASSDRPSQQHSFAQKNKRLSPPSDVQAGPFEVAGPYLIPTVLRKEFRRATAQLEVTVVLKNKSDLNRQTVPSYLALTPAKRQHRRLTWAERNARNALSEHAYFRICIKGWCQEEVHQLLVATGATEFQPMEKAA